ncbi:1546_t:CDS:2 [Funneliformis geosporum]|nr:1546_t:CDS:2 [Funneliformis geosporum]
MQQTHDPPSIDEELIKLVDSLMTQDPRHDEIIQEKLSQYELELIEDELHNETTPKFDYGTCMKCEHKRRYYRCSTNPQTFLEWIPYDKLERIKHVNITSYKASRSTVYSADWIDGPRIVWDQKIEEYKRSKIRVLIKLQYAQCGSLQDYILQNFYRLDWEIKLHLLFYLAEDLKALHNAGYVHWNLHPANILVLDNSLCAMGSFSNCHKAFSLLKDIEVVFEWRSYLSPEYIRNKSHTKSSNIYTFGMIMYTVGVGQIPFEPFKRFEDSQFLALDICQGLRPDISDDVPKIFKELIIKCWDPNPNLRPDISKVYDTLLQWWSSIYHNKCLTPLCLEFLAADNRNYTKSLESIRKPDISRTKDIVFPANGQLEPLELINFVGEAKIIDLGIAKSTETETDVHSEVFGMIPYIDPKLLENLSYKHHKSSDIYSLGVLMWELSSGRPPFAKQNEAVLISHLIDGVRERPIHETPHEYQKLYESCWDREPNKRPSIKQVGIKVKLLYEKFKQFKFFSILDELKDDNNSTSETNDFYEDTSLDLCINFLVYDIDNKQM